MALSFYLTRKSAEAQFPQVIFPPIHQPAKARPLTKPGTHITVLSLTWIPRVKTPPVITAALGLLLENNINLSVRSGIAKTNMSR